MRTSTTARGDQPLPSNTLPFLKNAAPDVKKLLKHITAFENVVPNFVRTQIGVQIFTRALSPSSFRSGQGTFTQPIAGLKKDISGAPLHW